MSPSLLIAWRNLAQDRVRLVASVGGVALALSLSLTLDAIFAGVAEQMTAYVNRAGADVWVSQKGVRNLHMVASWLPDTVTDEVRAVDGVAEAAPILYATDTIAAGDERGVAYVIGLPPDASMGGPWDIVKGSGQVAPGGIVVDRGFAQQAGVSLGDTVGTLGGEARIVGISEGTASLVNTVAFIPFDDFRVLRGDAPVVSYVLVKADSGASPEEVAAEIERRVPGVTAQSRAGFASEERRLLMDMSADVISIMSAVGFVVALAVVALMVYLATVARRREYGVLKALGARGELLYRIVLAQTALSVAIAFAVGLTFTALLGVVIPQTELGLYLSITVASLLKVGLFAIVIAGIAALLPIRQVAAVDPATVYRKGATI